MIEKPFNSGLFTDSQVRSLAKKATAPPEDSSKPRSSTPSRRRNGFKTITLVGNQREAAERLLQFYFCWKKGSEISGFRIRPPLLIGPSGAGKTTLIRALSSYLRMPYKILSSSGYIPLGSNRLPNSADAILDFVRSNAATGGWLLLDECDKFSSNTKDHSWYRDILGECMAILSRAVESFRGWRPTDVQNFNTKFFVCGAATFQHLQRSPRKIPTFAGDQPVLEELSFEKLLKDGSIVEEFLARFSEFIALRPVSPQQFAEELQRINTDLKTPLSPQQTYKLALEAANSGLGVRWLENYVTDRLLEKIKVPKLPKSIPIYAASSPDRTWDDFDPDAE